MATHRSALLGWLSARPLPPWLLVAVADSRWARALCVGCSWYKKKPTDDITFNNGNTASTYHEQRLFLASGRERSTRLLGGGLFGGKNQVLAGKYGNKKADTAA